MTVFPRKQTGDGAGGCADGDDYDDLEQGLSTKRKMSSETESLTHDTLSMTTCTIINEINLITDSSQ